MHLGVVAIRHDDHGAPGEVVAHLTRDHRADDRIHRQILGMAEMLSDGIAAQLPKRF